MPKRAISKRPGAGGHHLDRAAGETEGGGPDRTLRRYPAKSSTVLSKKPLGSFSSRPMLDYISLPLCK